MLSTDVISKILIIVGPTATGKTDLGLMVAKKFNGEIVSCDSRQVYTGLDIGTGKYIGDGSSIEKHQDYWIIDGVKIWMFDVVDITIVYTVFDYVEKSKQIIDEIINNGKLPIIVGGTGLYLKALLEGFDNLTIPVDESLRKRLEKMDVSSLQKELKKVSLESFEKMNSSDNQNPRRLIRQIELILMSPQKNTKKNISGINSKYKILKLGLTAPREILYKRVNANIIKRLNAGMVEEVNNLIKKGVNVKHFERLGLEYRIIADFVNGKIKDREEFIKILQGKIHSYVRRQQTWFKKENNIIWFDITDFNYPQNVDKYVFDWYNQR